MNPAPSGSPRVSRCVTHLLGDHREGERIIDELERLLNEPPADGCWSTDRATTFSELSRFFNEKAIGHVRKEEDILFPALEAYLPRDIGPLAVLRGEHKELMALFESLVKLGNMLSAGGDALVCAEFDRIGRRMIQAFRDHVYKEDRILYPMVARFLSPERDEHLMEQMGSVAAHSAIT